MSIELNLAGLKKGGGAWTTNVEFFTTGDLAGYVTGEITVFCGADTPMYGAEFLFRVHDPANGKSNTMVSFSETPTADQKPEVDEAMEFLTTQLVWYSNTAELQSAIGLEIPTDKYLSIAADDEKPECILWINGGDGYTLGAGNWKIADALEHYDTPEAIAERYDSWYRTWCD